MKKLLLLCLAMAGLVGTASAQYLVGDAALGLSWDNGELMTQDSENSNYYYLTKSKVSLEAGDYKFKFRSNQDDWNGTYNFGNGSNTDQIYTVSTKGEYDLLFYADVSQQYARLIIINKLQIKGAWDNWAGALDMNPTEEAYSYTYTWDLTDANTDQTFKFFANCPGHNAGEDNWFGPDQVGVSSITPILLTSNSNNYVLKSNVILGYNKFVVTAKWTPCASIMYNWTITIQPSVAREGISRIQFDNSASNWSNVFAYNWTEGGANNATWPGVEMVKIDDLYNYFYETSYDNVIFNIGSYVTQTGNLTFVADRIYDESGAKYQEITISNYGMSTFCSKYPIDFSTAIPVGLKAYRIDDFNKGTGELSKEEVTKIPANTGVYLEGTSGNYTVYTTATATSIGTNMLVGVTSSTAINQTEGDDTNYILTVNKNGGDVTTPKFYKVNTAGNTVLAGKAYLQIPTADAARESFWFNDESTAVEAMKQEQKKDGEIYNLAGQRVAQPTKGIYIANGKKVIKK